MGLFNSTVLEWAIGLVFVYLLLAIICTTVNEWIAGLTSARAKTLMQAIEQLLDNQNTSDPTRSFLEHFYAHPLITGVLKPGTGPLEDRHPSYLTASTFATVVMDLATSTQPGSISFADLEKGVMGLPDGDVKTALAALIQTAHGDLNRAQRNIEQWFDHSMQRVSGWYKKRVQIVTVCVAAALTIITNADTIRIGQILWTNGTVRSTIVAKAEKRAESGTSGATVEYPDKNNPLKPVFKPSKDELDALQFVLGWSKVDLTSWEGWVSRLFGWILSIAAVSLGAPFWFDLLSKLVNIRNAGQKPDHSDTRSAPQTSPPAPAPATSGGAS